jgi:hypothetical protein
MRSDNSSYEALAKSILNTDPRIFSCIVVSNPNGATLAEAARIEMQQNLGALTQRSNGMAGH